MLLKSDLDFQYPPELVATSAKPRGESRILHISRRRREFREISWDNLLGTFKKGDTLVLNDTQVLWARLLIRKASGSSGEIFFLRTLESPLHWEVMSRALNLKEGQEIELPGGVRALVIKTGRTSTIKVISSPKPLTLKDYFEEYGEVPLPPYISSLRKSYEATSEDKKRYQTVWAKQWGSVAAPTAGLHFSERHLEVLRKQGVQVGFVTLHVGAGTFMPIETEKLDDFQIHSERVRVGDEVCEMIKRSQAAGKKVWACGTTVTRALETAVHASGTGHTRIPIIAPFNGETRLFIQPGYRFTVVDALLTNFHQPESSLLALVAAFATELPAQTSIEAKAAIQKVKDAYKYAIDKKMRLFSYGDLTVIE